MHVRDYLEQLKRKPAHVRERIALGASSALVAVIAAGWLGAFVTSDALVAAPAQDPELAKGLAEAGRDTSEGFSELLGAASAFKAAAEGNGLVIVDGAASSTVDDVPAEDTRTVIPF